MRLAEADKTKILAFLKDPEIDGFLEAIVQARLDAQTRNYTLGHLDGKSVKDVVEKVNHLCKHNFSTSNSKGYYAKYTAPTLKIIVEIFFCYDKPWLCRYIFNTYNSLRLIDRILGWEAPFTTLIRAYAKHHGVKIVNGFKQFTEIAKKMRHNYQTIE